MNVSIVGFVWDFFFSTKKKSQTNSTTETKFSFIAGGKNSTLTVIDWAVGWLWKGSEIWFGKLNTALSNQ